MQPRSHIRIGVEEIKRLSSMTSDQVFRRRELQCHRSVNAVNDRSSYTVRRVSELDVLSAIGSVINASGGRGVTRFIRCEDTQTSWLCKIDRALLERHLTRLLQFSPSLDETCKHFLSDPSDISIDEGLDDYNVLIHYTVFALIHQGVIDYGELREAAMRPEWLVRMLYCTKQKALPMLVSWLLDGNGEGFQQLMSIYGANHKVLDELRLYVRRELEETRVFITDFLHALGKQTSTAGVPMATHIPETFIGNGGDNILTKTVSSMNELQELRTSYEKTRCSDDNSRAGMWKDILDPSLRCRVYHDSEDQSNGHMKYYWLPTEFHVGVNGDVVGISPLDGSLHPHEFPGLYTVIPHLLGQLLPLFECVLGSIATQDPPPPHQVGFGSIHYTGGIKKSRTLPPSNKPYKLRGRQIQVVVKMSTIQLDEAQSIFTNERDRTQFNRGWQLDGDNHEHIVAVGYHVLRSRNITPPKLAFRAFAHCPDVSSLTSQEDTFLAFGERTSAFYCGRYGRQFLQPWGSLTLQEGRSIVVPSFLTHRLEPFAILDAADPEGGELTIATFYLVDPTLEPIVSTRTIWPKQWQQTRRFVQANVDMLRCCRAIPYLPDEVASRVADFATSHISDKQAQLTCQELLSHRQKLQELRFMMPSLRLAEVKLNLDNDLE